MSSGATARLMAVGILLVAGCSPSQTTSPPQDNAHEITVAHGVQRVLDRRAQAIRHGDKATFIGGVAPTLRPAQDLLWRNLAQLPLGGVGYAVVSVDPQGAGRAQSAVRQSLQLDGFDSAPATWVSTWTLVRRHSRWVVADTGEAPPEWPWMSGAWTVERRDGVLGMWPRETTGAVADLPDEVIEARDLVRSGLESIDLGPSTTSLWDGSVVFWSGIAPQHPGLDGVTLPVQGGLSGARTVSYRLVLNPRILDLPSTARDRLIRHELVHVALGSADDTSPLWLSEGIAEWVSVQSMSPSRRLVSQTAINAARRGLTALPTDADFAGGDPSAAYGVSWWACQVIVDRYGPAALGALMDAFASADHDADPAAVVQELLGTTPEQLAADAGRRILATYS